MVDLHLQYQALISWLHVHPHWGILVAFLVSFAESIAIIGTIIPGTVTMTAIGVLAGSGVLPLWLILFFAILGAILGDCLSYLTGYHFKEAIRSYWPFSKYPSLLLKGKEFIQQHGGKSVFIGRFVGPVRAIVPVIAGILHLPPRRYFPISILSAILWAPFYMLPGILLGAISLEMPPHIAAELIIFVVAISLLGWLLFQLARFIHIKSRDFFNLLLDRYWDRFEQHPRTRWLCILLRNGAHPKQHGQLFLGTALLLCLVSLGYVLFEVFGRGALLHLNPMTYHIFRGVRTRTLDVLAIIMTSFGHIAVILPLMIVLLLWFAYKKQWFITLHWALVSALSLLTVFVFKHFYYFPRPSGIFKPPPFSSFPSGHTAFAITLYGFLAFLISQNRPKEIQKVIYWGLWILCLSVTLSRLYLCAHWLTDVLGSILIAAIALFITIISYRRFPQKTFSVKPILLISLLTLAMADSAFLFSTFHSDLTNSKPFWKIYFVPEKAWWGNKSSLVPTYRMNRFGIPEEVLNIEWMGSFDSIRTTLDKTGWTNLRVSTGPSSELASNVKNEINKNRSLLPKLFNDHKPELELVNMSNVNVPPMILRLWPAHIVLIPEKIPLWLGSVHYDIKKFRGHKTDVLTFPEPVTILAKTMPPSEWKTQLTTRDNFPKRLAKKQPVYKIVLIKPRALSTSPLKELSHVSS